MQLTHWRLTGVTAVVRIFAATRKTGKYFSCDSFSVFTLRLFLSLSPVPVANKRDTRSIEEAMNEIRAKKRQKREDDTGAQSSSFWVPAVAVVCYFVCAVRFFCRCSFPYFRTLKYSLLIGQALRLYEHDCDLAQWTIFRFADYWRLFNIFSSRSVSHQMPRAILNCNSMSQLFGKCLVIQKKTWR